MDGPWKGGCLIVKVRERKIIKDIFEQAKLQHSGGQVAPHTGPL